MSFTKVKPLPAVVQPRVISRQTGQTLLLEDVIRPAVERLEHPVLMIVGGPGSGKTTALRHLAAVLPPELPIQYVDDFQRDEYLGLNDVLARSFAADPPKVVIITLSSTKGVAKRADGCETEFRLARWSTDERIEYLLHAHPEQCRSVMSRLSSIAPAERNTLAGNPQLWRIVLDRMAADESIADVRTAWRQEIDARIAGPYLRGLVEHYCFASLVGAEKHLAAQHQKLMESGCEESLLRLLRHRCVQADFAAAHVAAQLSGTQKEAGAILAERVPRSLLHAAAHELPDASLANCLAILEHGAPRCQPMAASLLYARDSQWRPSGRRVPNLSRAYLAGATWRGVSLPGVILNEAVLAEADLRDAVLDRANAARGNFAGANLRGASLVAMTASGADFSRVMADEAVFDQAVLYNADFRAANLAHARMQGVRFREADLTAACLRDADLSDANLMMATIDGADFENVNFHAAALCALPLRRAHFHGARFTNASLQACDLETLTLPDVNFENAILRKSWLTGSSMPRANFRGANLQQTGLADIDWEGADLREADLRRATFHMGSTRSGLVGSPIACEGSRTGFYTDDSAEQHFKAPEEIRKANLRGADLRGARLDDVDFYLVDLRGAIYDADQRIHFERCRAVLEEPVH